MFFDKFFGKNKPKKAYGEDLLKCPRCNIDMEKLKKRDVVIDVCGRCKGMWLDAGESKKLAEIYRSELKKVGGCKNGKKI